MLTSKNYNKKCRICTTEAMTADIILMTADITHDFESHLRNGNVYLVEIQMAWEDENAEPDHGVFDYDVYLVANSGAQAHYIANTMYPDALSYAYSEDPIDEFTYVSRRNRSLLQGTQGDCEVCR